MNRIEKKTAIKNGVKAELYVPDEQLDYLSNLLAMLTSTDRDDQEYAKEGVRRLVKKGQEKAAAE